MTLSAGLNDIAPAAPEPPVPILNDPKSTLDDSKDEADSNSREEKDNIPDLYNYDGDDRLSDLDDPDKIIKSGADAAQYMLSARDDGDPAITVRSMVLGTAFAAFYASISQIYKVSPLLRPTKTQTDESGFVTHNDKD
jgi:hypothetical protein